MGSVVARSAPEIPIIILGGRDRRGSQLPDAGESKHPLHGYKAVDLRIGGRPLIATLVERLQACGAFGPIYVAGPAHLYEGLGLPIEVIDTDAEFAQNIRAGIETVAGAFPGRNIAVTSCDILPDVDDLDRLLRDYRQHEPSDFWLPQIRVPEDRTLLGESTWKPQYRFVPTEGGEPVATLPGHLIIFDPAAMRSDLVYRMFDLAYSTRNRPVKMRRKVMLNSLLRYFLAQDLKALVTFRAPVLTWEVVRHGTLVARGMRRGDMSVQVIAAHARTMLFERPHRKAHPERLGRLPILDGLSLAKDIDTEEEAQEAERRLAGDSPSR